MNKQDFYVLGDIFAKSDELLLRKIDEADKDLYFNLYVSTSNLPMKALEFMRETVVDDALTGDDVYYSIIRINDNKYLGNLRVYKLNEDMPEVGLDICEEYRNCGIGYKALKLFFETVREKMDIHRLLIRAYSNNVASLKLISKFDVEELDGEKNGFQKIMDKAAEILGDDFVDSLDLNEDTGSEDEDAFIRRFVLEI